MDTDKMLQRLELLAKRRMALEAEIDGLVSMLRMETLDPTGSAFEQRWEASWQDIGDALGISRQAAQQLYSRRWNR